MTNPRKLKIEARGERELVMTRAFDAPRKLVFDAHTKPELIKRWMLGPPGWSMPICDVDLRVGANVGMLWQLANQFGAFGQIGVRWVSGMSVVDGLEGTGLESINDKSARWTLPFLIGVRARF